MLLNEAKVRFPLVIVAPKVKGAPLLETMKPFNPWKARLLLETPIGGVKEREVTGAYLL